MLAMLEAAKYSAVELLRNRRRVEIRALRPDDRADLIAAVGRVSDQSLYRRFFGARRGFTEQEVAFFLKVDFVSHVAPAQPSDETRHSSTEELHRRIPRHHCILGAATYRPRGC
jgi:hypothetical protein